MTRTNRLGKASLKALTMGLMAMGLAVGASALATKSQTAFAYTPKASGQPGLTQVPVVQGASKGASWPEITFPTRYVWRSDAYAGTQVIAVTYRLWKYDAASGTWGLYMSRVSSAQVAPNGIGSWVSAWSTPVPFDHFAANFQVNWTTLDGSLFGWKVIDYNTPTDYQCLTVTRCAVYPSSDKGAFIYFPPPAPKPVATAQPTQAPVQGSAGNEGSTSVTFQPNSASDYATLFAASSPQNNSSSARCNGICRLYTDYDGLLGPIENNRTDTYTQQLNQAGAVSAGYYWATNNPRYGQVLY
jgi:hypothetical protein